MIASASDAPPVSILFATVDHCLFCFAVFACFVCWLACTLPHGINLSSLNEPVQAHFLLRFRVPNHHSTDVVAM